MGGELDPTWVEQAGGAAHFYVALAGFVIFRIIIAALQNRDELEIWFCLRRAGLRRRMRQAWL